MIGRVAWQIALGVAALALLPCPISSASGGTIGQATVIDGDTLEVRGQRVRLHGIDAFERGQRCGEGKGWPCGQQAALALDAMIGGRNVACEAMGVDRYKRIIARCFVDGGDLSEAMVEAGWALAYRRYSQDYIDEEDKAKRKRAGAWSGEFVEPWDYRKRKRGG